MRVVLLLSVLSFLSWNPLTATDAAKLFGWSNHETTNTAVNGADLRCHDLGHLVVNGSKITITNHKIKNAGTGAANASHVGFYLSSDDHIDPDDDIFIGRAYVDGLYGSQNATVNFEVDLNDLDTHITDGEYFVGAYADYLDSVNEFNENNNGCSWTSPKVVVGGKPNLACKNPGEFTLEDLNLKIGWVSVINNGDAPAGASKIGFYLSKDTTFPPDDNDDNVFLGSRSINPLDPGDFEMIPKFEIDLSTLDLEPGNYYVGYFIDYQDDVHESDENDNNNCSFDEIIKIDGIPAGDPDLICKHRGDLTIDGDRATITGTQVQNTGETRSSAGQVGFYVSSNSTITTNDLLVKTESLRALNPGEVQTYGEIVINLEIYDLEPGSYFIGLIVDDTEETDHDDTSNNSCFWNHPKYEVDNGKPNLACKTRGELVINNTTGRVYVSWTTIANYGDAKAGASEVGIYASTDDSFSDDDVLIGTSPIGMLAPGESEMIQEIETNYNPLGLNPGTYTVLVVIDHKDQVHEENEHDNDGCFWDEPKIFIPNAKADLRCKALGELVIDNETGYYYISWNRIENVGTGTAGASEVGYYVSTDKVFSEDDSLLATKPVPTLAPGESYLVEEIKDTIDLDLASGFYHVLVIIDHKDQVMETDEHNNDDCVYDEPRFFIPNKKPDLQCKDLGELIIDNDDLSYYIGWTTIINRGQAKAGASKIGFYVSRDKTLSDDDKLFASQQIGELAVGASQMITPIESTLDLDLDAGDYFVLTKIDYLDQVDESDEHNNDDCHWDEPRFHIPDAHVAPNLTCKERGFLTVNGSEVSISGLKIVNDGNDFSGISRVGIYLSTNQSFSTSTDVLIGTVLVPKLNPNQVFNINFTKDVSDIDFPVGTYFVGIIVDRLDNVDESNEDDNRSCSWSSPKVERQPKKPNLTCEDKGELIITNETQLKFSWVKVKNTGDGKADPSRVGYYLSRDRNIGDDDDIFLGSIGIGSLAAGETVMPGAFNKDVSDLDLEDGYYYAGFVVDYNDQVHESNEHDNNDCSYDNKVHIDNSKIDLICDSRGEVEVNGTVVKISWFKVKNIGNKKAPASKIGFYLSTDSHFSTSDYFIGDRHIEALNPGQVDLISSLTVDVADLNIPPGTYHIGSFIDYTKVVDEVNEHNNNDCSYTHKVTIPQPKPDLTCESRGELEINDHSIHVSWSKVKNKGDGHSSATTVGIYLSTDTNVNEHDRLIGSLHLPALAPGEVKLLNTFNKNISDLNLSPGKYYVGLVIDPHDNVHESNEHNNRCSWTHPYLEIQPPKPNLTCASRGEISANGSTIRISWMKIKNDGGSTAGASYVGYYLSTDTHFSTNDTRIGGRYVPSIAAGQTRTVDAVTINLSSLHLTPGEYFIGMIIDYKDDVHESDEHDNNDCFFHSPKVIVHPPKPNLTCMSKGELSVHGTDINYSWGKIKNDGGSTAGAHHVGYYLSTDQHFSTNDYLVGEAYVSSLGAGAVRTLPAFHVDAADKNVPAGNYYFGIIIDHKHKVHESDEHDNNDCYFTHPTVHIPAAKPDLKCKDLGEIAINGKEIHISWSKVINAGDGASEPAKVAYYLSRNTTIRPSEDHFIGSRNIPALSSGAVATIAAINVDISHLNLVAGDYYIGYYVDYQNKVHESNEHNNTCYWNHPTYNVPAAKPNLTLKPHSGHLNISNNGVLHFSDIKVWNNGGSKAGQSKLGYYLSTDANINPNHDILIGEDHVSELQPNAFSTESENIDISGGHIPAGTYYIGFAIDYKDDVHESHENDNTFRFQHRVTINNQSSKPDLTCLDAGHLSVISNNERVRIQGLQIKNIGGKTAPASKVGFFLSTDRNFTTSDYFVGERTIAALQAGKTVTITFEEDIPTVHPPAGKYYLGLIVDYDQKIHEEDEHNNNDCSYDERVNVPDSGNSDGGHNSDDYCACSDYNKRTFCDNFDSYNTGYLSSQSNCWQTWSGQSGNAHDGVIESSNGNQYLSIVANGTRDEQDVLLMLGERNSGSYSVEFKMWMFNGHHGYYNILHDFARGSGQHAYEVYFNGDGTGYVRAEGRNHFFTYPTFDWFTVRQEFDLTGDLVEVIINGTPVVQWKFSSTPVSNQTYSTGLAALNFYPANRQNQFYVDDIRFSTMSDNANDDDVESRGETELPAPVVEATDKELNNLLMSYYPNPASDNLTVEFESQQVVDMRIELVNSIGQTVMTYEEDQIQTIRHQFDLADQAPGMYYIRAWAGEEQIVRPVIIIDQR